MINLLVVPFKPVRSDTKKGRGSQVLRIPKVIMSNTNEEILKSDPLWYKDAVIYELHIKAFKDSNGDGVGDFKGLLEKLDYLRELGVTAIWLLPFYPSPLKDDGYDIADYFNINSSYGSIRDFKKFIREAHKRNIRVITELVINHTSDEHPWFQRARKAKKGSVRRDYYVWTDDPEKYKDVRIIFTDTESSNWSWDSEAGQYYWHRFFSHQPDLNYDNPKVQKEIFRVIDYWLNMGVDGFRLDAVPYLFEREYTNCENLPETHGFLKKLRKHVDRNFKDKLLLAEANMWPEESAAYFGDGDECHMNYHFPLMPRMFMAVKMEDRYPIIDIFNQTPEIPENCQWAMFLRNHDELTLEMVTDEERDYMYKVYTKDTQARINVGIRHRLAPLLDNNRKKIELMNTLLFSLPGTPVIYYGDEIGMGDNYYLGDRDGVRTPMQWSVDRNAGFSNANPQKLYLPVILDPEYSYEAVNVETYRVNPSSLWWWMKRVINMRKRFKAFSRGKIRFLSPENAKVLAFIRCFKNEHILVIANLSRFSQAVELDLKEYKGYIPEEVFSQNNFPRVKEDPYLFTLGPHGYYWFLLKKEEMEQETKEKGALKKLTLNNWSSFFTEKNLEQFENLVLPGYIRSCRWFGGKARRVQSIEVTDWLKMPSNGEEMSLIIFKVIYYQGLSEWYQLPVSFAKGEKRKELEEDHPQSLITKMKLKGEEGVLYDAVYGENYRHMIFGMMLSKKKYVPGQSNIKIKIDRKYKKEMQKELEDLRSRVLSAEQSNTSILYGDKFFLKFYRKLEQAVNPDIEISRFLSEKTGFDKIPDFMGSIIYEPSDGKPVELGMLQRYIPNHGDAWSYMRDILKRYFEKVQTKHYKSKGKIQLNLSEPQGFNELPDKLQNLIGGDNAERVSLLGLRTAEMHLALAAGKNIADFEPENFSLHYQRSLFSSMQSLVRSVYQDLNATFDELPDAAKEEAEEIKDLKKDILNVLRRIYKKKISAKKIRIHGDYHLGQVLFTGKDFIIIDFEGEPARPYSERRLKRSAARDVAGMVRSFHYAAYSTLFQDEGLKKEERELLEPWAEKWYHYNSGFFLKSYLDKVRGSDIIPADKADFEILVETFLLEKAVYELGYELNNRPQWTLIPVRGIKNIMRRYFEQ